MNKLPILGIALVISMAGCASVRSRPAFQAPASMRLASLTEPGLEAAFRGCTTIEDAIVESLEAKMVKTLDGYHATVLALSLRAEATDARIEVFATQEAGLRGVPGLLSAKPGQKAAVTMCSARESTGGSYAGFLVTKVAPR